MMYMTEPSKAAPGGMGATIRETHDFNFELKQCNMSGRSITFHFLITNNGPDISLEIYSGSSRLFDSSGNEYIANRAQLGSDRGRSAGIVLVSGVPTKAALHFENVSPRITTITLLELNCHASGEGSFKVQFRNIQPTKKLGKKRIASSEGSSMQEVQTDLTPAALGTFSLGPKGATYQAFSSPRTIYVKGKKVNIRAGAGTGYNIVASAKKGDSLTAIGKKGFWYHVRLSNSQKGYIYQKLITYNKPMIPEAPAEEEKAPSVM
jgi:hypothetical protein